MNTINLPARYARANRFEATVAPTAPFRGLTENKLDRLKEELLAAELRHTPTAELAPQLRRAAEEAAALVWLTPYPLLLLPTLLAEKAQIARHKAKRQAWIRQRSPSLVTLAE